MKAYTDLEQSKKLAEILSIESADMYYQYILPKSEKIRYNPILGNPINALKWYNKGYTTSGKEPITLDEYCVPCWSLAALLSVLPQKYYSIKGHETSLILGKPKDKWCVLYWDATGMQDGEQTLGDSPIDVCYEMICKLKESEDERIRDFLIDFIKICTWTEKKDQGWPSREDCLAWLEKQGESNPYSGVSFEYNGNIWGMCARDNGVDILLDKQLFKHLEMQDEQPTDKIEPKFKVGNWYQCTKDFFGKGVTFDKNTAYYCANEGCLQNEYGCHIAIVKDLYDNFKLWTIQDAEDGDVLLEEETGEPFIYNGNRATYFSGYFLGAHCGIYNGEFNPLGNNYCWGKNSCPATKEQRDLLFQKMKEAGYEWDNEKKKLKKIERIKL